ncbi:hypothetical protein EDB19DRAFT_1834924 [Suillus lakei]|nr:hypothetical protein EDB19DRAFT_1834924 [Suillus lakei]
MRFSFLTVIVALTASIMSVKGDSCTASKDCCGAHSGCIKLKNGGKICYNPGNKKADRLARGNTLYMIYEVVHTFSVSIVELDDYQREMSRAETPSDSHNSYISGLVTRKI